jgi:hypothetical protein
VRRPGECLCRIEDLAASEADCCYGGMDPDAAKELKELREHNGRLKRLLAEAELEKDALHEVAKGKILSPAAKRRAVDMLKTR